MNFPIINLNVRFIVVSTLIVLVANEDFSNNWPIVDHTTLIPSNYSGSTVNSGIRNGLYTINTATGFIFFQYIKFTAYCNTDTSSTPPYNIRGNMHIIEGDITMYMTTRYVYHQYFNFLN